MDFKYGDKIELFVKSDPYKGEYASQVLGMEQGDLLVALPVTKGHFVPIRPGSDLLVRVLKRDAAYEFESTVLERVYNETNKGLLLRMPEKIIRSQRRGDVRIEVSLPIEILIWDQMDSNECRSIQGRTIDLSAGGARIETAEELTGEYPLAIIIKLPDHEPMSLSCRYIRGGRVLGFNRYWTAVRFDSIKEKEKRQILKFVFRKQQDLRAKGLI